jgi:hypothetical protein
MSLQRVRRILPSLRRSIAEHRGKPEFVVTDGKVCHAAITGEWAIRIAVRLKGPVYLVRVRAK